MRFLVTYSHENGTERTATVDGGKVDRIADYLV